MMGCGYKGDINRWILLKGLNGAQLSGCIVVIIKQDWVVKGGTAGKERGGSVDGEKKGGIKCSSE